MKFIFLKTTTGNVTSDCLPDISFHAEPAPRPQERAEKQMTSKPAPFFLVCMCVCVCMYFCERRKEEHQGQSVRNGRQNSLTPWRRSVAWEIARGKRLRENSLIRSLSLSLSLSLSHTHTYTHPLTGVAHRASLRTYRQVSPFLMYRSPRPSMHRNKRSHRQHWQCDLILLFGDASLFERTLRQHLQNKAHGNQLGSTIYLHIDSSLCQTAHA